MGLLAILLFGGLAIAAFSLDTGSGTTGGGESL